MKPDFISEKDVPDRLISADAVLAIIVGEMEEIAKRDSENDLTGCDERTNMCLGRIHHAVNKLKFGQ